MAWRKAPAPAAEELPQWRLNYLPDLIYAIGDVHGCFDLYQQLERMILSDIASRGETGAALVVVLGDVIDRGPASAQVLDHLTAPAPQGITRLALRGNHEAMFLKFWDDPRLDDPWLTYGGAEMLASYHIDMLDPAMAKAGRLRQTMNALIPQEHVDFIRNMPVALHGDGYLFAHAGGNPMLPVLAQTAHDLIWGEPSLIDTIPPEQCAEGWDRLTLVHGHRPTVDANGYLGARRINLDTGAFATGRLTAIRIVRGNPEHFLIAQRGDSS